APRFVTWRISVSTFISSPSRAGEGSIAGCGDVLVPHTGSLRLLLEAMQYVDGFLEFGDVHHAVSSGRILNTNLSSSCADSVERLPIGGLKSGLDSPQLEAPANHFGERQ